MSGSCHNYGDATTQATGLGPACRLRRHLHLLPARIHGLVLQRGPRLLDLLRVACVATCTYCLPASMAWFSSAALDLFSSLLA